MKDTKRNWLILAGLTLGVCVTNGFARFAYGLLLPAMRAELGWSYTQAGWLNTANALGYVVGAVLTLVLLRRLPPAPLFAFGVWTTAITLFATGLNEGFWAQSFWRFAAGVLGAMSFATGGALAAALFTDNPRRNALSIAIYFGVGGGMGIVLSGLSLPVVLSLYGTAAWAWGWIVIGVVSFAFCPLALWAARQLRPAAGAAPRPAPVPLRRMLGEFAGYAGFGLGYIVYLTFIAAWMTAQDAPAWQIAGVWTLVGVCISASPFVWRGLFARFANGVPLALILVNIAIGSSLPVLWPGSVGLIVSAVIFGLSVFMAPGAITNFTRQNLPQESWGATISLFTVTFAVAQTLGPVGAGLIGDATGDIGASLLAASGVLLCGALAALSQRPLDRA
ncbi:YbfB/YjiJ family MFS transporter [Aestuariivita boseongensis]|uniref:YbfB/YjiJ family MFS transporter n=1 Tax=Aestuariivita boseongensis TaxID=1470562 RepID=UPI0006820151|nr:YbfB/YjiJ family MFS transporter [Aestuariivita boseongensis]